jgi:hypothetical protein
VTTVLNGFLVALIVGAIALVIGEIQKKRNEEWPTDKSF